VRYLWPGLPWREGDAPGVWHTGRGGQQRHVAVQARRVHAGVGGVAPKGGPEQCCSGWWATIVDRRWA
jgi:hypothetical protein